MGEIASHPDTVTCLLGGDARLSRGKSIPDGRKIGVVKRLNPGHRVRSIQPGQGLAKDARSLGELSRRRPLVSTPHETAPVSSPFVLSSGEAGPLGPSPVTRSGSATPSLVDPDQERGRGDPLRGSGANSCQ